MMQVPVADGRQSEAGFTLVETLVALMLTSLLAIMLFGAIRYASTIRERTTLRSVAFDKVVAVQDFLRSRLSLAYPLLISEATGSGHLDFDGQSSSISFIAPSAGSAGAGGRLRLSIAAEPSDSSKLVVLVEGASSGQNARKDVLLANIAGVKFSYLESGGGEPRWLDRWGSTLALPAAIKVNVRFPAGDQRSWPALLIAPRIDVDAACVLDDLTKRCRGR